MLQHMVVSLKLHWALYLFQMTPTRCTVILGIFISNSLHVSGKYVPIVRRTYCIYATLVFFTMYGWLSGLLPSSLAALLPIHVAREFSNKLHSDAIRV